MDEPEYCEGTAFELFRAQLPLLESTPGLLRAVTAIALHALTDTHVEQIEERLSALAERVRSRVHSRKTEVVLAHLHEVLFEEEGFQGDRLDYYSTLNSFLPTVLERRKGLPILLALIYKVVAEQVGLRVEGVNSPGHFLVRVYDEREQAMLIDPFERGRTLSEEEGRQMIESHVGPLPPAYNALPIATHRQWVARILRNLEHYFDTHGFKSDQQAMRELLQLVGPA